ncbi:hypothetical protein VIBNISFn135_390365 [Vibrio nigripulchritudo SFn135]|nr:hypothetical protein VIBNIBLFn1_650294 [Vibrio nigripulchritudo BLFn1]CCO40918.1 hypothetical protein VIBNISFn135_390365 [Vibrio nigripulchritudo SFn135]
MATIGMEKPIKSLELIFKFLKDIKAPHLQSIKRMALLVTVYKIQLRLLTQRNISPF